MLEMDLIIKVFNFCIFVHIYFDKIGINQINIHDEQKSKNFLSYIIWQLNIAFLEQMYLRQSGSEYFI